MIPLLFACTPPTEAPPSEDTDRVTTEYSDPDLWVCHPDRDGDACSRNLDIVEVGATGSPITIPHQRADSPDLACFYVYPTTSTDTTPNSDRIDGGEESFITQFQAGPYTEVCEVWAPLYRQVTILGLFDPGADYELNYSDIQAAFSEFRAATAGRPYLLIGHSQGTANLTRLFEEELQDDPELVAAHLLGGFVESDLPLCETRDDTGCIVHWTSYEGPPPADGIFGARTTQTIACTEPSVLFDEPLQPSFPLHLPTNFEQWIGVSPGVFEADDQGEFDAEFYRPTGILTAECVDTTSHHALSVAATFEETDQRHDDLGGRIFLPGWGWHLFDFAIASGNLVDLAQHQHMMHQQN